MPERIHFVSIGGSVMAGLAIALNRENYIISGSDDQLYEPSRSALQREGLLPDTVGWNPDKINKDIDKIIIGMHAKRDNPELLKAQRLRIPICSLPEYILSRSVDKQRIVVAGSHGKTTITALLIHILLFHKRKFDYVVGAQTDGIEHTIKLTDAPIILIEGDEYPCSPLDNTPKLLTYKHHIGVISGIAWDHANVFSSQEHYNKIFEHFAEATPKGGILVYNSKDPKANAIGKVRRDDVRGLPYSACKHAVKGDTTYLNVKGFDPIPTQLVGLHNMQNIAAAWTVLKKIGITDQQFVEALPDFKGAAGRLNRIIHKKSLVVYKDFAHSPSKVRASTRAIKNHYPKNKLVGCLELHTLGSLNKDFLPQYRNSMDACDTAIIYYNPAKAARMQKNAITEEEIQQAFGYKNIKIFDDKTALADYIVSVQWISKTLLMMSSGNFDRLDIDRIIEKIAAQQPQSIL